MKLKNLSKLLTPILSTPVAIATPILLSSCATEAPEDEYKLVTAYLNEGKNDVIVKKQSSYTFTVQVNRIPKNKKLVLEIINRDKDRLKLSFDDNTFKKEISLTNDTFNFTVKFTTNDFIDGQENSSAPNFNVHYLNNTWKVKENFIKLTNDLRDVE